jgi:hypothetical protein
MAALLDGGKHVINLIATIQQGRQSWTQLRHP